ncbi:hypothetical protein R3I93_014148 [Phoxinus phoxinus]|uniref:Uncharacterized protein n=1 Tax=Phoxinus phoxinus TaxID=58324 RepID=A0AAN9H4S2_9TELE
MKQSLTGNNMRRVITDRVYTSGRAGCAHDVGVERDLNTHTHTHTHTHRYHLRVRSLIHIFSRDDKKPFTVTAVTARDRQVLHPSILIETGRTQRISSLSGMFKADHLCAAIQIHHFYK